MTVRKEANHDVTRWCIDVTLGITALAVGVAGLVLPVLPGWIAIGGGLIILSGHIPLLRRWMSRLIMSDPAQSLLDRLATQRQTRRLITRALLRTEVRSAVEPGVRHQVVNMLASKDVGHGQSNSTG